MALNLFFKLLKSNDDLECLWVYGLDILFGFLGAFAKLRRATISFVISVRPFNVQQRFSENLTVYDIMSKI